MKSPQLVRLQQQFLSSLHAEPSTWLLNQIEPARGFGTADNVLRTYLSRAVSRTVDPLKQIYKHVRWLLGERAFETLVSNFYAQSLGEPLSPLTLSGEFASFIEDNFNQHYCDLLDTPLVDDDQPSTQLNALVIGVALLDWRLNWCELAPQRERMSEEEMLHDLHHRNHLWARPRLDRGTRLFHSIVDFHSLQQADLSQPRSKGISLHQKPEPYIVYSKDSGEVITRMLDETMQRILSYCDGTHTLASILYQEMLFGDSKEAAQDRIKQLISDRVIVCFQFELTTS